MDKGIKLNTKNRQQKNRLKQNNNINYSRLSINKSLKNINNSKHSRLELNNNWSRNHKKLKLNNNLLQ